MYPRQIKAGVLLFRKVKDLPKVTVNSRIEALRKKYAEDYDLSSLNNSNDKAALETILRNNVILEDLQTAQLELMESGISGNAAEVKKIGDLIKSTSEATLALERALGIDRKSRRIEDSAESPSEYIRQLKINAREFLEKRLIKVTCPDCNILVMRFAPLVEHTKYEIKAQCSQCKKIIKVHRDEKGLFFDLPARDREWRSKFTYEVEPAKKGAEDLIDAEDDEIILG